jgi:hypothetical protein
MSALCNKQTSSGTELKLADCNMIALFDVGADIDTQSCPLPGPKLPAEGYCAYLPKTKLNDPTVVTFCEWLQRIGSQSLTRWKEEFLAGDAI